MKLRRTSPPSVRPLLRPLSPVCKTLHSNHLPLQTIVQYQSHLSSPDSLNELSSEITFIHPSSSHRRTLTSQTNLLFSQPRQLQQHALIHLFQTITNHLQTNPYVIVYAMDFSKAFNSVRHKSVLNEFSQLSIPDHIYNWIERFLQAPLTLHKIWR